VARHAEEPSSIFFIITVMPAPCEPPPARRLSVSLEAARGPDNDGPPSREISEGQPVRARRGGRAHGRRRRRRPGWLAARPRLGP
jgi:hypothetical protein